MGYPTFASKLKEYKDPFRSCSYDTIQVNITKQCNLACKHCHVKAGPKRTEMMSRETMDAVKEAFIYNNSKILDITGGAPEMNPNLEYFLDEMDNTAEEIIVRTNLCVMLLPEYEKYLDIFPKHNVHLVASLPFYRKKRTDRQRGEGVFEDSIIVLQKLNERGYGTQHPLDLVFNPSGALMPPDQESLEKRYRKKLLKEYGIRFNNLLTITNMPLGRFDRWLTDSGNKDQYMKKLIGAFNSDVLEAVMCKWMISVDYDGTLYDCDFHLAENIPAALKKNSIYDYTDEKFPERKIIPKNYCYGCTAGAGSS